MDERYQARAPDIPQLVDMPNVGHGVLIAPRWVVTAAHTIQGEVHSVTIGGVPREVDHIEIHPGYRSVPGDIVQRALETGRALEINQFLAGIDDVALIRLSQPINDIEPIRIYSGNGEVGRTAQLFGKGATGTGLSGVVQGSPQRGVLRRAFNRIDAADGRWIVYTFDDGRRAHRLEGMGGSGDSGGPVLIRVRGHWTLAGLISWKGGDVDVRQPGSRYGQPAYNVRLSHYAEWIQETLSRSGDRIVLRQ
ncbi:MAG: trypsin-like serine protease [Hyphomonadaceae bacterium]|nr:trypsin-like serine protease [Hyphomonadaceae bacterium]